MFAPVMKDSLRILSANKALSVKITHMTGRVVSAFATTPETIEVSNWSVGIYFVRVGNEAVHVAKTDR